MSEIKDKKIAIYEVKTERDLHKNERNIKRYIHDRNNLYAYVRELSEREKFSAKAVGVEQSTLFKINYNSKIRVGQYIEFRGDTFIIQSIDGYEWYQRDLTLRAVRSQAEAVDYEEYDE